MTDTPTVEAPPELPTLKIIWDAETQTIGLNMKHEEFKTWEFVLAVLEMAKKQAELFRNQAMAMAAHQQMQAQQQAGQQAALRERGIRKLLNGRQ